MQTALWPVAANKTNAKTRNSEIAIRLTSILSASDPYKVSNIRRQTATAWELHDLVPTVQVVWHWLVHHQTTTRWKRKQLCIVPPNKSLDRSTVRTRAHFEIAGPGPVLTIVNKSKPIKPQRNHQVLGTQGSAYRQDCSPVRVCKPATPPVGTPSSLLLDRVTMRVHILANAATTEGTATPLIERFSHLTTPVSWQSPRGSRPSNPFLSLCIPQSYPMSRHVGYHSRY